MDQGLDQVSKESNGSAGQFAIGLLVGAAVGAGIGLLFAPKVGSQLRQEIGDRATNLANVTTATYRKASDRAATGWKAAKTFYDNARSTNGHNASALRG